MPTRDARPALPFYRAMPIQDARPALPAAWRTPSLPETWDVRSALVVTGYGSTRGNNARASSVTSGGAIKTDGSRPLIVRPTPLKGRPGVRAAHDRHERRGTFVPRSRYVLGRDNTGRWLRARASAHRRAHGTFAPRSRHLCRPVIRDVRSALVISRLELNRGRSPRARPMKQRRGGIDILEYSLNTEAAIRPWPQPGGRDLAAPRATWWRPTRRLYRR